MKESDDENMYVENEGVNKYENTDENNNFKIVAFQGSLDEVSEKTRRNIIDY